MSVCGYGDVAGLKGANCRHDFHPFIKGVSTRIYTDEQLDKMNAEENIPREFGGKEYTNYEATQKQRRMETSMRASRQKIALLEQGGADEDDIISARVRYRRKQNDYVEFSKAMGLPEEWDRVTIDSLDNVGNIANKQAKASANMTVAKSEKSGIINNTKAVPLSRYLNSSESLYKNACKVEPIEGFEDVFIHGDKFGFSIKDKDGKEHDYYTPREFAEVLRNDPNYHGGKIRLFSCETAAEGANAASALATQLGVEIKAPSDIIWINYDGNIIIGPDEFTNSGKWIDILPFRKE